MFVDELARLGADVRTDGHHALVRGVAAAVRRRRSRRATSAPAPALVLAGLVADGETHVAGARHIDRGYAGIDLALRSLGADVVRTRIPDPAYA